MDELKLEHDLQAFHDTLTQLVISAMEKGISSTYIIGALIVKQEELEND